MFLFESRSLTVGGMGLIPERLPIDDDDDGKPTCVIPNTGRVVFKSKVPGRMHAMECMVDMHAMECMHLH